MPPTHCWPGPCFHGGPPFYCYSVSEKSHKGSCWQARAPFNGEISLSPHPPVSDEPVSDLDSGCIQPSFVSNPLSYPLHLAFLTLCLHFASAAATAGLPVFLSHNHVSRRRNLFTYAEMRTICLAALGACSRTFFWLLQTQIHVNSFSCFEMLSYTATVYYSPVSNYVALFLIPRFSALVSVLQCPFCHWRYSLVE